MRELAQFHQNLLGMDLDKTPVRFRISPIQRRLYDEIAKGKHGGFLPSQASLENWDQFLATFVAAYAQTTDGMVLFVVSAPAQKWVLEQVKTVARRIFASRTGKGRSTIQRLFQCFQHLSVGSNVLQVSEPPRWVAYGFNDKDVLPPWMRGKLAIAKSKSDPVGDETRAS